MSDYKEIKIVNNGNVFNTGNWYVFYCPYCNAQLTTDDKKRTDNKYSYYKCSECNSISYLIKEQK